MRRLLEIECFKIRNHRPSVRLLLIYFVLIIMILFLPSTNISFGHLSTSFKDLGVFDFPLIWHFGSYISLFLKFILIVIVVSSVTGEYSNLTLKQNLIDGLSKKEFLLSKSIMLIVFSLLSVFILFLCLFFIGWSNTKAILDWSLVFSEVDYFLGYLIRLVGFLMFGVFSSILFRRSALALGFIGIWWIVEGIISLLLKKYVGDLGINIGNLLPLKSMSNIVPNPFQRIKFIQNAAGALGQEIPIDFSIHYIPMLQSILWILVFFFVSYRILQLRNL